MKFLSWLRSPRKRLPDFYQPWLEEVVPLLRACAKSVDRKSLNQDRNERPRVMTYMFYLGVICWYSNSRGLTYGQRRALFIEATRQTGVPLDASTTAFDHRNDLTVVDPAWEIFRPDALDAGYRAGREYFEADDFRAPYLLRVKIRQWADPSYTPPGLDNREY